MKKHLLPLFTVMAAFAMFGCNNTKVPATEKKTGESVAETAPAETAAGKDSVPAEAPVSAEPRQAAEPVSAPEAAETGTAAAENDQETTGGTT